MNRLVVVGVAAAAAIAVLLVGCGSPNATVGEPSADPVRYDLADGGVTLQVPLPWVTYGGPRIDGFRHFSLTPEGAGPTTDPGERIDWDQLMVWADPLPVGRCWQTGPRPADAEALAESIRSEVVLGGTAPVAVSVGGTEALMMDVTIAAGAKLRFCEGHPIGILQPLVDMNANQSFVAGKATGHATGERMRLYLFDVPKGSSMRVLAIAIIAPESRFESTVEVATPVVDSVAFNVR